MFSQPFRQGKPGKDRIYRTNCWKERLIAGIGILDVMKAAQGVGHGGSRVVTHPERTGFMVSRTEPSVPFWEWAGERERQ
jgi:hypothetical protein